MYVKVYTLRTRYTQWHIQTSYVKWNKQWLISFCLFLTQVCVCESLYLSDVLLPLFPASAAQCLQPDCSALRAERILGLCYGWRSGGSDDGNDERWRGFSCGGAAAGCVFMPLWLPLSAQCGTMFRPKWVSIYLSVCLSVCVTIMTQ